MKIASKSFTLDMHCPIKVKVRGELWNCTPFTATQDIRTVIFYQSSLEHSKKLKLSMFNNIHPVHEDCE